MWRNGGTALLTVKHMEVSGKLHDSDALPKEEEPSIAFAQEAEWAPGTV